MLHFVVLQIAYSQKELLLKSRAVCLFLVVVFIGFLPASVFSQDNQTPDNQTPPPSEEKIPVEIYSLGQHSLSLGLGLFIPLFFQSFDGDVSSTNLSLGVAGSLQWGIHLGNKWMVGAEIAGSFFTQSVRDNRLFILPITLNGTYIFQLFPIEIPVTLGLGMSVIKYQDQSHIDFILKPGFSPMWKYNSSWSFGLNVSYWWIFQSATGNQDKDKSRMGNFLSVMPVAQYNF